MRSSHRMNLDELRKSQPQAINLFLDDGGVLNDNRVRATEWLRLIGEFMPSRLGGTAEQWTSANRVVFPSVWSDILARLSEFASYQEFQSTYSTRWMSAMCDRVGVPPLPDDRALALNTELSIFVGERATSAIAGATDAVRALHRAGYTLYTASGTSSWDLRAILGKMGIADVFSGLYGPDLIDHVKYGAAYYRKVFDDAGVSPSSAIVIESDAEYCSWASEAGAKAIWVDLLGRGDATTLEMLAQVLL